MRVPKTPLRVSLMGSNYRVAIFVTCVIFHAAGGAGEIQDLCTHSAGERHRKRMFSIIKS